MADQDSYKEWSHKAKMMSKRELQKEIALRHPQAPTRDHYRQLSKDVIQVQAAIDEETFEKVKRVQQLLSHKTGGTTKLCVILSKCLDLYLNKHDPARKTQKPQVKSSSIPSVQISKLRSKKGIKVLPGPGRVKRRALSTALKNNILRRDEYSCQWRLPNKELCASKHFIEIHHKIPLRAGGKNTASNLVTLCSGHHKAWHEFYQG